MPRTDWLTVGSVLHPPVPVQIIDYNYGPLLSDPDPEDGATYPVDRVLTSVVAVACLRAQQGGTLLLSFASFQKHNTSPY